MALVRIKGKYQVTIPTGIRNALELEEGDMLEIEVQDGKLIFTPKVVLDRESIAALDEALDEVEAGETVGPFDSVEAFKEHLKTS